MVDGGKRFAMENDVQLHVRREPFEYGLLPLPKLIFSDGISTLRPLKEKLLTSSPSSPRIDAATISHVLQISSDHTRLILDTISAILPPNSDPLALATSLDQIDTVGADINDLLLFLYIQSYKRFLPKAHKDSAAVADVWPSTSAFDGYLSALSPLQLVRSNSRRFMPSQADEEAHQLSYLQKHLSNILALLAEPAGNGREEELLVLTSDIFDHLGFLIQLHVRSADNILLSQAASFFANSDPDMPAVPVPVDQVHAWVEQNITASLEQTTEKSSSKENGPIITSDADVTMVDASESQLRSHISSQISFIEGVSKSFVVKDASDIGGRSVKVINCHDSAIYVLAPLAYATIHGCSDASIVLGAVGKYVRVEHCERVQVITATKRICIANCRECVFFLGANRRPLVLGDNHKVEVAPYNTFYSRLEEHMSEVGLEASVNMWDQPLLLGMVDPHDSLSHSPGVSDVQVEPATCVDPDHLTNFMIPSWFEVDSPGSTRFNPFSLPEIYMTAQRKNHRVLSELKHELRDLGIEDSKKREIAAALHVYFKDWLYTTGNIRQLYCLQGD